MIKIDEIEFVRPVGGSWCITTLNSDLRGQKFAAQRSDDGATFYVTRTDVPRTIAVPRESVLWWHDAEEPAKAGAGKK